MSPAASETSEQSLPTASNPVRMLAVMKSDGYLSKEWFEIPLLKEDGSNYTAWKFRQTTILNVRGLLGIINQSDHKPSRLDSNEARDPVKLAAYNDELAKWTKRDEEAFAQIVLAMEDGAMVGVAEITSAAEAWAKIVERWERKSIQSTSLLYQQLLNTKIDEDGDITTGINNLRTISSKIRMLGEPVSDSMLAQIIMNALPPSYAVVHAVIQMSNQHCHIGSDTVIKAALAEEACRKRGLGLTAMFTQAQRSKSANSKATSKAKKRA